MRWTTVSEQTADGVYCVKSVVKATGLEVYGVGHVYQGRVGCIRYFNGQTASEKDFAEIDILYLDESPSSDPEVQQLRQWKKEATELLYPIIDYGQPHTPLGKSITEWVLNQAKRAEELEREVERLKYVRGLLNEEDKDDKVLHNLIRIIPLVMEITADELMPLCVIGFKPGETLAEPINVKFATCSKESDKILLVLCKELVKQYAPSSDPAEVLVKMLTGIVKWKFATDGRKFDGDHKEVLKQVIDLAETGLSEYEQLKQQ